MQMRAPNSTAAMGRGAEGRPDWRDDAPYRALMGIDAAGLAWEWLRRDPDYAAWWQAQPVTEAQLLQGIPIVAAMRRAHHWGLHFRRAARPPRA